MAGLQRAHDAAVAPPNTSPFGYSSVEDALSLAEQHGAPKKELDGIVPPCCVLVSQPVKGEKSEVRVLSGVCSIQDMKSEKITGATFSKKAAKATRDYDPPALRLLQSDSHREDFIEWLSELDLPEICKKQLHVIVHRAGPGPGLKHQKLPEKHK